MADVRLASYVDLLNEAEERKNAIRAVDTGIAQKADKQTKEGGFCGGFNAVVKPDDSTGGGAAVGAGANTTNGISGGVLAKSTLGAALGAGAQTETGIAGGHESGSKSGAALGLRASSKGGAAAGWESVSTDGGAVGAHAVTQNGGAVGMNSWSLDGAAIGKNARAQDGAAVGKNAKVGNPDDGTAIDAVQIGEGVNTEPRTLKVYDYRLLNSDGTIPKERIFDPTEIILPSALYGVTGQEINIYKQNLILHNRLSRVSYIHTRFGTEQTEKRTIWNPSVNALTETPTVFEVFKDNLYEADMRPIMLYSMPKDTGSGNIKVLIIGDSKVQSGYISHHFMHNFDDDNISVTLLGTKYTWDTKNRNEGYGGKTTQWFCENESSPFSNNGVFDFENYLSANSIDRPDFVFINLGTNDCSMIVNPEEDFVDYLEQMIASIHSVNTNTKIIIGLCEGVCTLSDTNPSEFLNWDLNCKIQKLHKVTIEAFDNRSAENIYVCPMYMGMDLENDYNITEVPLSVRDDGKNNKKRIKVSDVMHQNEIGYWKNADYMYAIVKYIIASKGI